MSRRRVDLHKLPTWAQYLIGIAVAAGVAALAWSASGHRRAPGWVNGGIRVAGVALAILVVAWLIRAAWRRR